MIKPKDPWAFRSQSRHRSQLSHVLAKILTASTGKVFSIPNLVIFNDRHSISSRFSIGTPNLPQCEDLTVICAPGPQSCAY